MSKLKELKQEKRDAEIKIAALESKKLTRVKIDRREYLKAIIRKIEIDIKAITKDSDMTKESISKAIENESEILNLPYHYKSNNIYPKDLSKLPF